MTSRPQPTQHWPETEGQHPRRRPPQARPCSSARPRADRGNGRASADVTCHLIGRLATCQQSLAEACQLGFVCAAGSGYGRLRRLPGHGVRSLRRVTPDPPGDLGPCAARRGAEHAGDDRMSQVKGKKAAGGERGGAGRGSVGESGLRDVELREVEVLFERDLAVHVAAPWPTIEGAFRRGLWEQSCAAGPCFKLIGSATCSRSPRPRCSPPHRAYVLVRMPVTTADASGNLSCRRRQTP